MPLPCSRGRPTVQGSPYGIKFRQQKFIITNLGFDAHNDDIIHRWHICDKCDICSDYDLIVKSVYTSVTQHAYCMSYIVWFIQCITVPFSFYCLDSSLLFKSFLLSKRPGLLFLRTRAPRTVHGALMQFTIVLKFLF